MSDLDYAIVEEYFCGNPYPQMVLFASGKLCIMTGEFLLNPTLDASEDDLPRED